MNTNELPSVKGFSCKLDKNEGTKEKKGKKEKEVRKEGKRERERRNGECQD